MALERCYSLREAARIIGIGRVKLKKMLAEDLAMVFPPTARGSKLMIRESDLEIIIRKHSPKSNWALLRPNPKKKDAA